MIIHPRRKTSPESWPAQSAARPPFPVPVISDKIIKQISVAHLGPASVPLLRSTIRF